MAPKVYKTLAKIVGVVLVLVGVAAIVGGRFAGNFIADQLSDQKITIPTREALDAQVSSGSITQETADALAPYAGRPMTTGAQAKAYAMMIHDHMDNAVRRAGLDPQESTFSNVGDLVKDQEEALTAELTAANPEASQDEIASLVKAEIADPTTERAAAARAAELTELRYDILLNGNTLRSMLLNAYGWGLLGTIAGTAGTALVVIGVLLTGGGFLLGGRKAVPSAAATD